MLLKPQSALFFSIFIFYLYTKACIAAPWVEQDNLALRNDIQLLADVGIITAPVTSYPLMWNAIKEDILSANTDNLTSAQSNALAHVRYNLRYAMGHSSTTKKSIYLASKKKRFTSFGNDNFDQGNIEASQEFIKGNWAGKIQANYRINNSSELYQGSDFNIDHSYLAYKYDNWVLVAGAIERWWGPGIDTNLILSSNNRPLPAISIIRDNSSAFESPWLNWIGPWTLTAQMAKLESNRSIPDTLMWSSRATMRPFRGLELGASWSFQWAGEGQPSTVKDFFKILFGGLECADGEASCDPELNSHQGNHLAGYDARWSDIAFNVPYAVYLQTIGEDGSPNGLITDKANMYGAEIRFNILEKRILANIEYTDTQTSCGATGSTALNCFYEHGTYKSGYRYYRRTIGSTYDNDAQTFVATFLIQTKSNNTYVLKFRKAQLNTDNIDRYPNDINLGNPVSKVSEDVFQFDGQYKFIALDSRFTLGILITDSTFGNNVNTINGSKNLEDGTEIDAYVKWEYRF